MFTPIKRVLHIAGRDIPGLQVSPAETEVITTQFGKRIPVQMADVISLRETNPALGPVVTYLTMTRENLRFSTLRKPDDYVVGLDVSEDGTLLSLDELEEKRAEDIKARQVARLAAQSAPIVSLED